VESEPVTELDARFSSPGASPTPWEEARGRLEAAEVYWLMTVRPDGRPHATPLLAVWLDGAMHFSTGPSEVKARNLAHNRRCALVTGGDALGEGLDLVVEGETRRVTDDAALRRLAGAWVAKYGEGWRFEVRDGAFHHEGGEALVFEVVSPKVLGFRRGEVFSQTRWRFEPPEPEDWEGRLAGAWASIDQHDEASFLALIEGLAAEQPADSPRAAFERASAFDSTGHSDLAVPLYRQALAGGLDGGRRRRAVVQLASSLRNLGHADESVALLTAELHAGTDELDDAVRTVLALALTDVGREREAVSIAVGALARHLPRYQRSMAHYARLLLEEDAI